MIDNRKKKEDNPNRIKLPNLPQKEQMGFTWRVRPEQIRQWPGRKPRKL
jgi:hypothetical protein